MSSQDSQSFGILIGEKPGQMRRTLALRMKRMLEKAKGDKEILQREYDELTEMYQGMKENQKQTEE